MAAETSSRDASEVDDDEESHPMAILPWDRFSNWVHCICIVTFDLELGQALEVGIQVYCVYTIM